MVLEYFERKEKKYMLSEDDQLRLFHRLEGRVSEGEYPRTDIFSLFYYTANYELIRRSVEKPMYKEKLRVRCYRVPQDNTPVYVEVKKKYDGIVYKRRSAASYADFCANGVRCSLADPRVEKEIAAFLKHYGEVRPKILIGVERYSYVLDHDPDQRLTIDRNMIYRLNDFDLTKGLSGERILKDNAMIMELKFNGAIPLWLAGVLDECRIYPHSFSKVGYVFENYVWGGKQK